VLAVLALRIVATVPGAVGSLSEQLVQAEQIAVLEGG
jgi:hypothetical protein